MRVTGQNGMSGMSTLGALEKLQVVDEDGKDRTPKPLLASRSHVQTNDNSMWSGEAPESISIIERQARPSAEHLLSSASFKFDNTTKGATSKFSTATQVSSSHLAALAQPQPKSPNCTCTIKNGHMCCSCRSSPCPPRVHHPLASRWCTNKRQQAQSKRAAQRCSNAQGAPSCPGTL